MSRVKRVKEIKKQKIKETIIGLSLTISIGLVGSLGSYAYFSDRVDADNGVKITMGTLDVGIERGFNKTMNLYKEDTKDDDLFEITNKFRITNKGTLDEILTLKFENISLDGFLSEEDLNKVEYKLKIIDENENVVMKFEDKNLNELVGKEIKLGRLNAGKSLTCTAEIEGEENLRPNYQKDMIIKFDLVVNGVQINDKSVQKGGAN